ncbi:uncharacterized protein LOC118432034 [Branchiostoma floridae]|uniref:Uncharacterized protein LOC118432034 n=1 Tax=Branchiostoma floridae TaxID=7739 RepID=A0A9J7MHC4_BRAFL|nr:uncharacterized protein LOC118432034 [Branchiostoma floridae]
MGNNQAARIRQRAEKLEWTDEILSPGEVLNDYDLPVFVTVAREDPQADLAKDDIYLLRSSYSERDVFARKVHRTSGRLYGPLLTIPLKHPAKFVIFKKVFYNGVSELLRANPFPESFRVEENVTWRESGKSQEAFELLGLLSMKMSQNQSKDGGHVYAKDMSKMKPKVINMSPVVGDCLTVIDKTEPIQDSEEVVLDMSQGGGKKKTSTLKRIKSSFKGKKESRKTKTVAQPMGYLVCANQTGGLVCLHTDCTGRFSAYLPEQYTMEELLENFKLPGDVEVVGGKLPDDHPNFGGRLRLLSFCTETFLVVNGLPKQGEVTGAGVQAAVVTELSIDSDVRFTPARKSSPQNVELLKLLQGHLQRVRPCSEGCVAAVSAGAATDAMRAEWAESQARARAAALSAARRTTPAMTRQATQPPPGKQPSWWRRLYNSSRRRSSQLTETPTVTPPGTRTTGNVQRTAGYGPRPLDIIEEASDTENSDTENSDTDNSSLGLEPEEQDRVMNAKKGGLIPNGGLVSKALSKMGRR